MNPPVILDYDDYFCHHSKGVTGYQETGPPERGGPVVGYEEFILNIRFHFFAFKRSDFQLIIDIIDFQFAFVGDFSRKNFPCDGLAQLLVDQSFERPRTVGRVVADMGQMLGGAFG